MKFFGFRKKTEKGKKTSTEKAGKQRLLSPAQSGFAWREKAVEEFFGSNKKSPQVSRKNFSQASSTNHSKNNLVQFRRNDNTFFKASKQPSQARPFSEKEIAQPIANRLPNFSSFSKRRKNIQKKKETQDYFPPSPSVVKKNEKKPLSLNSNLNSRPSQFSSFSKGDALEHSRQNLASKGKASSFSSKPPSLKKKNFSKKPSGKKKAFSKKVLIKICDLFISLSFFAIVFGIPLFVTGLTLQSPAFEKQIYFYIFLMVGFLGWIVRSIAQEELVLKRTALDFFIVILLVLAVASSIFSVDKWHSFWGFFDDPSRGLIGMFALAIFCYLVMGTFNKTRSNIFAIASFFSSAVVALWSFFWIFQPEFIPKYLWKFLSASLLGSVNNLTVFLAMAIPVNLAIFLKISKKINGIAPASRLFLALVFGNIALALFVLAVFSNFIPNWTIVLGGGCFLLFALAGMGGMPKRKLILPMLVFIVLIIVSQLNGLELVKKIEINPEIQPSFDNSWEAAKKALSEKMFLGAGPANFGFSFSKYHHPKFNDSVTYNLRFYQGSNLVFEAISTLGLLGTVALFSLLLSYLGTFFFFLVKAAKQDLIFSIGWFSAFVVFVGAALTTKVGGGLLLFGVISGVIALVSLIKEGGVETGIYRISLKISPKYALTFAFLVLTFLVGSVFSLIFVGKIYWADVWAGKIVQASWQEGSSSEKNEKDRFSSEEDGLMRIKYLKKAIEINPKEGRYWTQLGQEYMSLVNEEYKKGEERRNLELLAEYLRLAAKNAKKGVDLMPQDALAVQVLAQIYENAGIYVADSLSLSLEWYEKAAELEPANPDFVLKIGQIKDAMVETQSDFQEKKKLLKEAREYFEKAIQLKKNYSPGYYNLALNYEKLGELDKAIETIQKAIQYEASSGTYFYTLARLLQIRGREEDVSSAKEIYEKLAEVNPNDMNVHLGLALAYEYFNEFEKAAQKYDLLLGMIEQIEDEKEREAVRKKVEELKENAQNRKRNDVAIISREIKESQVQASPMQPSAPKTENLPSSSSGGGVNEGIEETAPEEENIEGAESGGIGPEEEVQESLDQQEESDLGGEVGSQEGEEILPEGEGE